MAEVSDIAVVIPVYNRAKTVLEALESVRQQSLPPKKLVVVDDGSTDGTAGSIRNWMAQHQIPFEVQLLEKPNGGVSSARNLGIAEATDCQFLAFLDSDDLWPSDYLLQMNEPLKADDRAVAITANYQILNLTDNQSQLKPLGGIQSNAAAWMFQYGAGIVSASIFRTEHILALSCFDESLRTAEDSQLFLRIALQGSWLHVPGVEVIQRQGINEARGEYGHLSNIFDDTHLRWAEVHEDFILNHGGDKVIPRSIYVKKLSRLWQRAGADFLKAGEVQRSRECLRRSLIWRKWYYKAWWRLATTYMPGQEISTTTRRSA